VLALGDEECSADGECGSEESSLLALRGEQNSDTRRITCHNRDNAPFNCALGDTCCGDVCVAKGDVCCVNINGNTFPCQGKGGGCCGNACFAPGSKCCMSFFKRKNLWYPVSKQTKCRKGFSDAATATKGQLSVPEVARLGAINPVFGGIEGGVFGGVTHGKFENDFDWDQLGTWGGPKPGEVCRDPQRSNQCFPVKSNGHYGPPCGIVNPSNGCFQNAPTQTCALCTYPAQPYCSPFEDIPICGMWNGLRDSGAVGLGMRNPVYGGIQGGVFGGLQHGQYDNDVDWKSLSTWNSPKCDQVCRSPSSSNQCFPVKRNNGRYGPPCGIVDPSNGCFQNEPTQTCALCTYPAQPYCCPFEDIPIC